MTQNLLQGQKLNQDCRIQKELFDLYDVEMPISAFLNDEKDTNYSRTKTALMSMSRKIVQYEDVKEWRAIPLILTPRIRKYESIVKFRLHEDIYNALLNFSKGFKKYELNTAFKMESVYAMRLYELLSNQKRPLIYSIKDLKLMFGVENKYKLTADFIKRVIDTAQRELNEKSPYSFEYAPLKTGRKITSIKFYPLFIPKNQDENAETVRLKKRMTFVWGVERHIINYLKDNYNFTTPELKNNQELLEQAQKEIDDFLLFLSTVKAKANRATNPKGYLINALKKRLKISTKKEK
jgi:plasmid replication initiation protein